MTRSISIFARDKVGIDDRSKCWAYHESFAVQDVLVKLKLACLKDLVKPGFLGLFVISDWGVLGPRVVHLELLEDIHCLNH